MEFVTVQLAEPASGYLEYECAVLGYDERAPGIASLLLRLRAGGQEAAEVQEAVDYQPDVIGETRFVHVETFNDKLLTGSLLNLIKVVVTFKCQCPCILLQKEYTPQINIIN